MAGQRWALIVMNDENALRAEVERIARHVELERIVVVASEENEAGACAALDDIEGVRLALEPRDLGTGPSLLFGLACTLEADPDAEVMVSIADRAPALVGSKKKKSKQGPTPALLGAGCAWWEIVARQLPRHADAIATCGSRLDLIALYDRMAEKQIAHAALEKEARLSAIELEREPLRKSA
jgi:hypothetical protein